MFGGDFGLPPGPRYGRRSTGGAPPVAYLCHAVGEVHWSLKKRSRPPPATHTQYEVLVYELAK